MPARSSAASAPLFLKGARVTSGFRASLFDAANRAGITPNEFCIETQQRSCRDAERRF